MCNCSGSCIFNRRGQNNFREKAAKKIQSPQFAGKIKSVSRLGSMKLQKNIQKRQANPDTGKNKCHAQPDIPGNGQVPFFLQIILNRDANKNDTQGDKSNSN